MIYMASKTKHAHLWRALRNNGLPIISTWIDEANPGETADFSCLWTRCIAESSRADVTIVYAEPGEILKGAFVEVGCALASGKRVLAVGLPQGLSVLAHPRVELWDSLHNAIGRARQLSAIANAELN